MPQVTTNFSWLTSLTAEAQYQDLWWDQLNVVLVDQDAELYSTKTKGKETIFIPAAAMNPTSSNGCASLTSTETTSGRPDIITLDFDDGVDEFAQFQIAMPKSWDKGVLSYQVFWTTAGTDTGNVIWNLEGVSVSNDDTINVDYGTVITVTDAGLGTANDLHVSSESGSVTLAGSPEDEDMTYFRIARDGSVDTLTGDARLIGIKLFFTTDGRNDD